MYETSINGAIKVFSVDMAAVTTAAIVVYGMNRWRSELRGIHLGRWQIRRRLMQALDAQEPGM